MANAILKTWGRTIRARRLELELTVDQVAGAVGVDRSNLVRWEAGSTEPKLEHRVALARVLDAPTADLFPY